MMLASQSGSQNEVDELVSILQPLSGLVHSSGSSTWSTAFVVDTSSKLYHHHNASQMHLHMTSSRKLHLYNSCLKGELAYGQRMTPAHTAEPH